MVEAVDNVIIPQLAKREFRELEVGKESIPMRHLHRVREDGGYDAISIIFDKRRRPSFCVYINVIGPEGLHQPWGEVLDPRQATAVAPLRRVVIRRIKSGLIASFLPRWCRYEWFGFSPKENADGNRSDVLRACEEFMTCIDQAERWWASRELGPNLVSEEISVSDGQVL